MQPQDVNLLTTIAIIAFGVIIIALVIAAALSASTRSKQGREQRIDASVFDSLLTQEARAEISALPSIEAKHKALEAQYLRLQPQKAPAAAKETSSYYLAHYGAEVGVERSKLHRQQDSTGYTDSGGAFVPLYAGSWDAAGESGSHHSGGFFDGGFGGDGGGSDGGGGDGGGGGGGGD